MLTFIVMLGLILGVKLDSDDIGVILVCSMILDVIFTPMMYCLIFGVW